jgi:hypothetical protein
MDAALFHSRQRYAIGAKMPPVVEPPAVTIANRPSAIVHTSINGALAVR